MSNYIKLHDNKSSVIDMDEIFLMQKYARSGKGNVDVIQIEFVNSTYVEAFDYKTVGSYCTSCLSSPPDDFSSAKSMLDINLIRDYSEILEYLLNKD